MKKTILTVVTIMMAIVMSLTAVLLVGCKDDNQNNNNKKPVTYYNNASDPLVFSTQDVDGVFNPFFSTSGTDSNVVGMTQLGMISNNKLGEPVYGDGEACIVKDLDIVHDDLSDTTTYYMVLKNNVKFSNGSPLTMKDVLFNLYVYLDPQYTGSSTIYSTDIVGLKAYRTNQTSEEEQENFKKQFETEALARIDALIEVFDTLKEDDDFINEDADSFRTKLDDYVKANPVDTYKYIVEDYDKACELFQEELKKDYSNSKDTYEDIIFTDKNNNNYKNLFTTDVEAFLYNEGYYSWNRKEAVTVGADALTCILDNDRNVIKSWTEARAINTVFEDKMPRVLDEILTYWATATELSTFITNQNMEKYFASVADGGIKSISGIKFANRLASVSVNGVDYAIPAYADDGSVTAGNEVLSITINKVDPKAIWNFAFGVAPMYYYSNQEQIALFDYEEHFGVEKGSQSFMNNVVKDPTKIGVPVGAGAYVASKATGGTENVASGDFLDSNIIYFEANPHFLMGEPLIKKIRFQIVSTTQVMNALDNGEIDFAEPNAKPDTINELKGKKGIGHKSIKTSGYGYIGINAGKVPSLKVRQAIMHSINTLLCVEYYETTATAIHRSMSTASWAYPEGCTSYYPYIGGKVPADLTVVNPDYADYVTELGKKAGDYLSEAEQIAFIEKLLDDAGYKLNSNGVYQQGSNVCKYTFTIAGQETDHPAYQALFLAGEFLNKIGFEINTTPDSQALRKLSSGDLTVWAAAWGSTIDPDMYQVYHKDSTATSVLNWGYKQILANIGGKYDTEYALVEELSDLIDKGRETNDKDSRASIYSQALDIVMQLAIELPTYQRDDLFAYNILKIDETTFTPESELSPFKGLTSDIHTLSLVVERQLTAARLSFRLYCHSQAKGNEVEESNQKCQPERSETKS